MTDVIDRIRETLRLIRFGWRNRRDIKDFVGAIQACDDCIGPEELCEKHEYWLNRIAEWPLVAGDEGGNSDTDMERLETWSDGWPSEPQGVIHYARCPSCGSAHRSGDAEHVEQAARGCCVDTGMESDEDV